MLLTDVDMPGGIGGIELVLRVRDRWPPIGTIMVSGRVRLRPEDVREVAVFFTKPYVPQSLMRQVRLMASAG